MKKARKITSVKTADTCDIFHGDLFREFQLYINASTTTLSAGLAKMQGQYGSDYPAMMAAAVLAIVPMIVIYIIFQKQFVEGIATSGGKL